MNVRVRRAQLLLGQGRFEPAEQECREALGEDPGDPQALALLALALLGRTDEGDPDAGRRLDEAERAAGDAIAAAPDEAFPHHVRARVLLVRRREEEAIASALEAIRFEPEEPDHRALIAQARFAQRRWADALAAADEGLRFDPEHASCARLRALALVQSGRREEAGETLRAALARNPDDPTTHTALGWARLEARDPQGALTHFQEALRLDPTEEGARAGIVEALKARHRVYALFLRYLMFMAKLTPGQQWGIVIGGYLAYRGVLGYAKDHPEHAVWVYPLIALYLGFVLLSWLGKPMFNLALRLDRFGRHALSDDQRQQANLVGGVLVVALVLIGVWVATGHWLASAAAIGAVVLLLPISAIHSCDPGWPRTLMSLYTLGLACCPLVVVALAFLPLPAPKGLIELLVQVFLFGSLLSGFVANALISARPRR